MDARVITVSRTLAAGGKAVARAVAAMLGFRYVDDEIIVRAAKMAGVSEEEIERVEHTPEFIAHMLETISRADSGPLGRAPQMRRLVPSESYRRTIERAIREVASEGDVVIVSHAAGIPLAGLPGLLRVQVTASPGIRADRLARHPAMTPEQACEVIRESDAERANYLARFYGVPAEQSTHHDLVISTDILGIEEAARVITTACGRAPMRSTRGGASRPDAPPQARRS